MPNQSDTQLNGVSGRGLLADGDDTTCVPASNRDVIWDAANTTFTLYYKGTGFASSMNITGTSIGVSVVGWAGFFAHHLTNGVFDDSFTTVDSVTNDCSNDFSNVPVSGKYGCKFGNAAATNYFGRFIPDHFVVTQGLATPAAAPFLLISGRMALLRHSSLPHKMPITLPRRTIQAALQNSL